MLEYSTNNYFIMHCDEMGERNEEIDINGLIAMDECERRSKDT